MPPISYGDLVKVAYSEYCVWLEGLFDERFQVTDRGSICDGFCCRSGSNSETRTQDKEKGMKALALQLGQGNHRSHTQ